ncbi:probable G-protein coupled receptor 139 [Mobula birostris]|uniref:probable G-protein coupled receptor 139 n=1 Tax=Mobula birostris TaxID=1983395 RepID=UPI003B284799
MVERYFRVEKILYLIFAVIGAPVNLVAIAILSRGKCGLSTCTTRYLVAMAATDLLVIVNEVILYQTKYHYFPVTFLNLTPMCTIIRVLTYVFTDCSVWFTVAFTFDRFVAISCQKLKTKYCTGKTAAAVLAITGTLFCLKNIPIFFTYGPKKIIDNVPWFCYPKPSYFSETGWVVFDWVDTILTPLLPFALILLLNILTVRNILVASRIRKGLRGQNNGDNNSDPEIESRRRSMVLLLTLSGNFILLWLTFVLNFLYYQITGTETEPNETEYIFSQVGRLLSNFSCCTNTFIYVATQSKFRTEMKSAVESVASFVFRLINH